MKAVRMIRPGPARASAVAVLTAIGKDATGIRFGTKQSSAIGDVN